MTRVLVLFGAALGCVAVQAADLRILTAGAYKSVLVALAPTFEQRTGHRLQIDNDTAGGLVRRVGAGEAFDLLVLTAGPMQQMAQAGHVAATGRGAATPLARVGIGVAVKEGAPRPDISSIAAFQRSLLAARAIATVDPAAGGTSGIYLWKQFEAWGIAAQLRPKAVLVPGGLSAARVASGEAEIAVQQMSELLAVPGVVVVGPVPAEMQNYTVYAGAVAVRTSEAAAAQALLEFLAGPEARAALAGKGMEAP